MSSAYWLIGWLAAVNMASAPEGANLQPFGDLEPANFAAGAGAFDPRFATGFVSGARLYLAAEEERKPTSADMIEELQSLKARLAKSWKPPAGAKELILDILIKLNRDGTLVGPPTILSRGNSRVAAAARDSAVFAAARDSAVATIYRAQPFDMLKPEHYDAWKEMVVIFDPRQAPAN